MSTEDEFFSACMIRYNAVQQDDKSWVFSYSGYDFKLWCTPSGKHKGLRLQAVPESSRSYPREFTPLSEQASQRPWVCDVVPGIVFSREGWWTRLGKRLRLDRELQVGDARFDNEVYIETNIPSETMHPLCMNAEFRQSILKLFDMGIGSIQVFHDKAPLWFHWPNHNDIIFGTLAFPVLLDALVAVLQALPPLRVKNPKKTALGVRQNVQLFSIMTPLLGWMPLAAAGCIWEPLAFAALGSLAIAAVVFWVLGFVALVRYLSRFSGGLRVVTAYVLGGLPGSVVALFFVYLTLNGLLSPGDPVAYRADVHKAYVSRGKSTSYHVKYTVHYQGEKIARRSQVSSSMYSTLKIKKRAYVFIAPGLFHRPWVAGITDRSDKELTWGERLEYITSF